MITLKNRLLLFLINTNIINAIIMYNTTNYDAVFRKTENITIPLQFFKNVSSLYVNDTNLFEICNVAVPKLINTINEQLNDSFSLFTDIQNHTTLHDEYLFKLSKTIYVNKTFILGNHLVASFYKHQELLKNQVNLKYTKPRTEAYIYFYKKDY